VESKYKILALVQARMGSVRCPGKSLVKIQNYKVVELVLKRLLKSQKVRDIVLITSKKKKMLDLLSL
jgi:spore coat polysaccharide biosynthesis protein SpsF (cytidylyltransferase family)